MKSLFISILLVLGFWSAFALASPCTLGHKAGGHGVVRNVDSVFFALADGQVTASPFMAGDMVSGGRAVLTMTSMEAQTRLVDIQGRIADLNLRLLEVRNAVIVNQASLAEYQGRNGTLSNEVLRRVNRQDEIDILLRDIAELRQNAESVTAMQRRADGIFPYPLLLLSDPPRVAETVKSGTGLFHYSVLDRLNVAIYGAASAPAPVHAYVELGPQCLRLDYLRATVDTKSNAVEWQYQARVMPALTAAMAQLLRSPQAYINVFY